MKTKPSIIQRIRRKWLELFPRYRTVEGRAASYEAADRMIRETEHLPDPQRWHIWPEKEDANHQIGVCYIHRRERIVE